MRLNKALSTLGICSRREADRLITAGKVLVNNITISEVGTKVSETDKITVDHRNYSLKSEGKKKTKVWIYYKPKGLVTTHKDEKNRMTVFDDIKTKINERVISVGRLDLNSEGLLLLTNDNNFSTFAEYPNTAWERRYKVRVFGTLSDEIVNTLKHGIEIDGIRYAPMIIKPIRNSQGMNHWIECSLTEGKNREIRKIFAHFSLSVNRLIRVKYGPYELGELKPGDIKRAQVIIQKSIQSGGANPPRASFRMR